MDSGQIILFQTQRGETKIEVLLANETVVADCRTDVRAASARPMSKY